MKKIETFIQPFMLDRVVRALQKIEGLPGVIVSDAHCVSNCVRTHCVSTDCGRDQPEVNKRVEVIVADHEVMVADHQAVAVIDAIATHARTGKPGDGGVFVSPVNKTETIRTRERHVY